MSTDCSTTDAELEITTWAMKAILFDWLNEGKKAVKQRIFNRQNIKVHI